MRNPAWFGLLLLLGLSLPVAAVKNPALQAESTFDPSILMVKERDYLGSSVPKAVPLIDQAGKPFTLGKYSGKPFVLLFSYYGCDGVCSTISRLMTKRLSQLQRFELGRDFNLLVLSFDQNDTQHSLQHFMEHNAYRAPGEQETRVDFALFKNPDDITDFTQSFGYRFFWSQQDEMFVHPNVLVFVSPSGRIARYIYGEKTDSKDLELALIDADWERIANSSQMFDMLAGVCFSYNFTTGKYQPNYPLLVGFGSFLLGAGAMVIALFWAKRKFRHGVKQS